MRIAIVNQHPRDVTGGSELQCDLLARGLARRGHAVRYVAVSPNADSAADDGLEALPYEAVRSAACPEAIVSACREHRADVIYWRMNRAGLAAVVRRATGQGIPVVLATAHVDDVTRWPRWDATWRSGLRRILAEVRRSISHRVSWRSLHRVAGLAAQRQDFLGRTPVPRQRLVRNVFDPSLRDADETGDEWAWPRPYVVWVGNVKPRKRPEELLPLVAPLAELGVDLLVVGAFADQRSAALLRPTSGGTGLHTLGGRPLDEVLEIIAGARALVVTAREEGFSNVLIQAWWHGTPVVSLGYDPDGLIARHGLGTVCGEDRAAFRAAVLESALPDPSSRRSDIRAFAQATFGLDVNMDELEALLSDVVGAHAKPGGPAS